MYLVENGKGERFAAKMMKKTTLKRTRVGQVLAVDMNMNVLHTEANQGWTGACCRYEYECTAHLSEQLDRCLEWTCNHHH